MRRLQHCTPPHSCIIRQHGGVPLTKLMFGRRSNPHGLHRSASRGGSRTKPAEPVRRIMIAPDFARSHRSDVLQLSKSGKRAIGRVGPGSVSCRHLEHVVDELNLSPHIRTAHPPRVPLPDHVHGLVALESFAAPRGMHESPAWPSLVVCSLDDPAPECCSSIGLAGGGNGVAGVLPFSPLKSPIRKGGPGPC